MTKTYMLYVDETKAAALATLFPGIRLVEIAGLTMKDTDGKEHQAVVIVPPPEVPKEEPAAITDPVNADTVVV